MNYKKMNIKKIVSVLLLSAFAGGCIYFGYQQQTLQKWASYMGQGEVGNQWIASSVAGAVTSDYPAGLQDDYMGAVAGDYISKLKIADGKAGAGMILECIDIMNDRTLEMLQNKTLTGHEAELAQSYYELATDWETRNKEGITRLQNEMERIAQFTTLEEVTSFLTDAENPFNMELLCDISVTNSMLKPGYNTVEIGTMSLMLEDAAEYTERTENGDLTEKCYVEQVKYLLSRMGYTEKEIADMLEKRSSFETKAAAHMLTQADVYEDDFYKKIQNEYTLEQIKKEEGNFPLAEMLHAFGYDKSESFILEEPEALRDMGANLYQPENLEEIKSYLMTAISKDYITSLDREAYDKCVSIQNERLGRKGSLTDEEIGLQYTNEALSGVLDNLYVQEYCSEEEKQKMITLIEDIIGEYRVMLEQENWLSEETRQKALKKLDTMKYKACYPDELLNYEDLTFASKAEGGSYFDASCAIRKYDKKKELEKINQPVNPNEWGMSLREANAFYDPLNNSINILSGQAVGDFSLDASYEQILAAVGAATIGHEISHSFDTTGAQFDENGNYVNWWTEEDYQAFAKRADRLASYFNQIVPFEGCEAVNGNMVKTEAIADMGGLKVALMMAAKTPGFDYDEFFRQFAMSWADIYPKEYLISLNHMESHPMDYLRVNTTLSQFQEFYDTYDIKPQDGMYLAPEDRVAVW